MTGNLVTLTVDGVRIPSVRVWQTGRFRWSYEVSWPCEEFGGWYALTGRRWTLRQAERAAETIAAAGRPRWMPR